MLRFSRDSPQGGTGRARPRVLMSRAVWTEAARIRRGDGRLRYGTRFFERRGRHLAALITLSE